MARIRSIKPSFFLDEEIADSLTPVERLAFIGLWTLADREGRMKDRPRFIKASLFPYDDDVNMASVLDTLTSSGWIVRYQANGQSHLAIRNFLKHQRPRRDEHPSEVPPPQHVTETVTKPSLRSDETARRSYRPVTTKSIGDRKIGDRKVGDVQRAREAGDGCERAGKFCQFYRWELYPEVQGVAYTPQQRVEVSDLESAERLTQSYTDEQLRDMAKFFLEIPDDRDKFLRNKKRTVTMLLSYAEPIAKKLWGHHNGTNPRS